MTVIKPRPDKILCGSTAVSTMNTKKLYLTLADTHLLFATPPTPPSTQTHSLTNQLSSHLVLTSLSNCLFQSSCPMLKPLLRERWLSEVVLCLHALVCISILVHIEWNKIKKIQGRYIVASKLWALAFGKANKCWVHKLATKGRSMWIFNVNLLRQYIFVVIT